MKYLKFKEKKDINKKVIEAFRNSNLRKDDKEKILNMLGQCGESIYVSQCKQCNTKYFAGYWACKSRFCAVCSYKLHLSRFRQVVEVIEKECVEYISHLVFTVRSQSSLKDMLNHVKSCLRAMDNDKGYRKFKDRYILGQVRNIEVKYGRVGWHVHVHVLIAFKEDVRAYEFFRDIWKRLTRGKGSVFITRLKSVKAVLECTKYNLKILNVIEINEKFKELRENFDFVDDDFLAEMYYVLKGCRLFSTTGIFRNVKDDVMDDLVIKECKVCGSTEFDLIVEKFNDVFDVELLDLAM